MPPDPVTIAARPPTTRSRVTNGSRLFLSADGRSTEARRYRDLIEELSRPLGGMAALGEPTRQLVRRAAALSVKGEMLEGALARGESVDGAELVAVTNTLARLLDRLAAAAPKAKAPGQLFDEHMARLAREEAS